MVYFIVGYTKIMTNKNATQSAEMNNNVIKVENSSDPNGTAVVCSINLNIKVTISPNNSQSDIP